MEKIKFLNKHYFQKSSFFLYPLLRIPKACIPIRTYLSWKDKYKFKDYKLICEYKVFDSDEKKKIAKENIFKHLLYEDYQETEVNTLIFVFDIFKYKDVVDEFIIGRYSQIPERFKNSILSFYKDGSTTKAHMESFLYPNSYFETYSKLLDVPLDVVKTTGELSNKPNLKSETFAKSIKNLENLFLT